MLEEGMITQILDIVHGETERTTQESEAVLDFLRRSQSLAPELLMQVFSYRGLFSTSAYDNTCKGLSKERYDEVQQKIHDDSFIDTCLKKIFDDDPKLNLKMCQELWQLLSDMDTESAIYTLAMLMKKLSPMVTEEEWSGSVYLRENAYRKILSEVEEPRHQVYLINHSYYHPADKAAAMLYQLKGFDHRQAAVMLTAVFIKEPVAPIEKILASLDLPMAGRLQKSDLDEITKDQPLLRRAASVAKLTDTYKGRSNYQKTEVTGAVWKIISAEFFIPQQILLMMAFLGSAEQALARQNSLVTIFE